MPNIFGPPPPIHSSTPKRKRADSLDDFKATSNIPIATSPASDPPAYQQAETPASLSLPTTDFAFRVPSPASISAATRTANPALSLRTRQERPHNRFQLASSPEPGHSATAAAAVAGAAVNTSTSPRGARFTETFRNLRIDKASDMPMPTYSDIAMTDVDPATMPKNKLTRFAVDDEDEDMMNNSTKRPKLDTAAARGKKSKPEFAVEEDIYNSLHLGNQPSSPSTTSTQPNPNEPNPSLPAPSPSSTLSTSSLSPTKKRKSGTPTSPIAILILDPERAAQTWQDYEITIYDPTDADDDGEGVNGIGFKQSAAVERELGVRRRRQIEEWRRREQAEARGARREARRGKGDGQGDGQGDGAEGGGGDAGAGGRHVRFVDGG